MENSNTVTQTFNGNFSGTNNTTNSGNIESNNIVNIGNDSKNIKELLNQLKQVINDTEINEDEKLDVIDEIKLLDEELDKKDISKRRVDKTLNRIKSFIVKMPALTTGALTVFNNVEQIIEKILNN
ncbi:hypothetical protein QTG94_14475 [Clostridium perfringens]|nr:hypothetical protein [Clostridium perfringens]